MVELNQIPHIDEIAHHGVFHGAAEKKPATFQERSASQNKIVPSLEEAIRRTGLRDGMTISFHHHFRNGDHIINQVVALLTKMGFRNLTLAPSSLSAVHAPLIEAIRSGVITHIETSGMRGELAEQVSRGLIDCPVVFRSHGGRASAIRSGELHIDVAFLARRPATPTAMPTATAATTRAALPAARSATPERTQNTPITLLLSRTIWCPIRTCRGPSRNTTWTTSF